MENHELVIKIPRGNLTDTQIENLRIFIEKKKELFKKAFLTEDVSVIEEDGNLSFPWFTLSGEEYESKAYLDFVAKLIALVRRAQRVNTEIINKTVVNDAYAFRCFLLRLGFIGDDYKNDRKILMKNFTKGSSAFRQKKENTSEDTQGAEASCEKDNLSSRQSS